MKQRDIHFYSEGHKLVGTVYLPDDYKAGEKRPVIIPNSGYQGFNAFYPKLFSRYFTAAGYVCLGFDYRGYAESEGPQGRFIIGEQVEDIRNAVTFAQTLPEADPERIGLLGWGMGAPSVIEVTATDPRVKAVAGLNGFYNGERWLKSIHTPEGWEDILKLVAEDRIQRVTSGTSKRVEPFVHYLLDPATNDYVEKELAPAQAISKQVDLQFTESIISMNIEPMVAAVAPRPLFIAHGKDNMLHPKQEAEAVYTAAHDPKELYWIDGKHNDFMFYDHPVLNALTKRIVDFFRVL
jgi:fermentation-respiration switch protein FrsA (DUF1100 family)